MMTKRDIPFVIRTVQSARRGRATLPEMAQAHHLASSAGLSGISGELSEHIAEKTHPSKIFTWSAFLFGITIGLTANMIARLIPFPKKQ